MSIAFDWQALPQDAVVVDVGGGVGFVSMALAKTHSHLKIVIQDRPPVVEEGKKVSLAILSFLNGSKLNRLKLWGEKFPEALEKGSVVFEGTCSTIFRCAPTTKSPQSMISSRRSPVKTHQCSS